MFFSNDFRAHSHESTDFCICDFVEKVNIEDVSCLFTSPTNLIGIHSSP